MPHLQRPSVRRLQSLRAFAVALVFVFVAPIASAKDVVEYYHRGLDHYFVTSDANEIRALDGGTFSGWVRTGYTFQVFNAGDTRLAGSVPVCRFYGNPLRGLDSHFYSATPQECDDVQARFPNEWLLESTDVFHVHPVASNGQCPVNTKAVYRLYNGRPDVNHRYTTDGSVADAMLAKGYAFEGIGTGPRPIVFCAASIPAAQPASGAPVCTVSPSTQYPVLGTPLELRATCTGSPTTFGWINCASHTTTCTASAEVAGPVMYGIVASNGSGAGPAATVTLNWQPPATEAPTCTLAASSTTPLLGSPLTLTGTCAGTVARHEWLTCGALTPDACSPIAECANATTTCSPVARQAGAVLYSLRATNSVGTSPKASVAVNWIAPNTPPPPPSPNDTPACVLVASSTTPAINSTLTLTASCTNAPTQYTWTNCTSTSATCTTTSSTTGNRTYSISARNASGFGPTATVTVAWQVPPTAPPTCTLNASPASPYAGGTTTLTASCTQSPTSYNWNNCTAVSGNTCTATSPNVGAVNYSVTATNALGTSNAASITVNWQTPPPAGADFCGNYTNVKRVDLPWGGQLTTNNPAGGLGGFAADGVLVARIRVPTTAAGTSVPGAVSAVEYIDGQANRIMSLSPSACDFRGFSPGVYPATDSTGATRPMAWGFGINPSVQFLLSGMPGSHPKLVPGQTYYINMRNRDFTTGQSTCRSAECNVRITVQRPS